MKKILLLIGIIMLQQPVHAKIWRVNNTSAPADFTTAQQANDAGSVVNGDTLHFEPSGLSYGGLFLRKALVIIGNGYFLGTAAANSNPDLQANTASSKIDNLYYQLGSSNSVVEGMYIITNAYISWGGDLISNILFRRNYVGSQITMGYCSNVQLSQNYIGTIYSLVSSGAATNLVINNNILVSGVSFDADDNGSFQNNVMHIQGQNFVSSFTGFTIRNNIAVSDYFSISSSTVENNVSWTNGALGNGLNGNIVIADMTTVFEDLLNASNSFSQDSRFQVQAASPAKTNGTGGGECGIFGTQNGTVYSLSGISNVPTIYKLTAPATVSTATMNVTISTKTNN
ncbi:MAG: hypothetical protein ABI741_12775 [Ferruginibacter sp.]